MEAMKMKMIVGLMMIAFLALQNVANAAPFEAFAPAPAPTAESDATVFLPAVLASFGAAFFALLF
nr:arabinogalactan protein 6 [Centaurium erythraea]